MGVEVYVYVVKDNLIKAKFCIGGSTVAHRISSNPDFRVVDGDLYIVEKSALIDAITIWAIQDSSWYQYDTDPSDLEAINIPGAVWQVIFE